MKRSDLLPHPQSMLPSRPAAGDFAGAQAPGVALEAQTRAYFEQRFGHDFSDVRVHADAGAARAAEAAGAAAYAVGRQIVFAEGRYAPQSETGRRLLAHELAHAVQQKDVADAPASGLRLGAGAPGDAAELAADAAAMDVIAGLGLRRPLAPAPLGIARQTPGDADKKAAAPSAGDVVVEGLKTVAEQAKDNNPQVKKVIIDPVKDKLKGQWDKMPTEDKVAVIGTGAATLGLAGGALLSDRGGRKVLEGVNLATPFTLIPYMPLSGFKYTLPSGATADKRLFKFETSFDASDLLNLRTEARGLPKMSLSVNLRWAYDPSGGGLSIQGGDASLGIVPGLSISGGAYKDILRPPQMLPGGEGQLVQVGKSLPEGPKPQAIPDVRVMVTIDLMKFKPAELGRQLHGLFHR